MRPLRYSINVTLDGCVDHRSVVPDEELHRRAAASMSRSDTLLLGRITYQMMESAWRLRPGVEKGPDPADPFVAMIDPMAKVVVSDTLPAADWNAELVRGADLEARVRELRQEAGTGVQVGGVRLPLALAEADLIDEYEFVVHPRVAGYGPTLLAGLSRPLDLDLVESIEYDSGAVATRYVPRRRA